MFLAGFFLLWAIGSLLVGGGGFGGGSAQAAMGGADGSSMTPLANLREFRDLSYVPVKGVYISAFGAGKLQKLLHLADTTEINAFVCDVKDDSGYVTYDADVQFAKDNNLINSRISSVDNFIGTLREHNITPIARIVCFADNNLAKKRPDLAIQKKDGTGEWKDSKGHCYLNPYKEEVWDYLVQLAEDAARHGFREIQFDYVRFPSDGDIANAAYPGENSTKDEAIKGFLAYAHSKLEPLGVWVSADVFGLTTRETGDMGIGQNLEKIADNVDIVCPMVYPSHYSANSYGLDDPNRYPYELVTGAMADAKKRLAGTGCKGRPWLQDFSWNGFTYGVAEVKAQIKAAEAQGFDEWILWNPNLNYSEGALRSKDSTTSSS